MSRIRYFSLLAGSICLMAASSNAASLLSYQFSYAPGAADRIQPFDFSFLSSAFVNNNQTLNFRPYVVTDGTNSFTITQGITGSGCFNFGTSTTSMSGCGGSVQPGGGGFEATFAAGLPTTLGSFTSSSLGGLFETSTTNENPTGSLTVDITAVPEPSTMLLFIMGIAALITLRRKRHA